MASMYCPSCFNQSLYLNKTGVIEIRIDGKQMDSGRFLFNVQMEAREVERALDKKLEEFMRWYGNFQNKEPIERVEIITSAVLCSNSCKIPINFQYNIIDDIISSDKVMSILKQYADKYKVEIHPEINL